jgi:DNA-binding LacI/PurR family transcriptional regulator
VRRAAADLDYRIDRAASLLRSGKTQVICALVPSLENPFFTSLIAAIERHLRADGYDIIIASGNDEADERARMAALLSWRPAGVVVVPSTDAFASRGLLEDGRIPYVTVDRVSEEQGGDSVTIDNAAATALAARHLLDLGHRRVLVVASSLRYANIRERCVGIGETYRTAGLEAPRVLEVGLSFEEIDERLETALAADPRPTGVIALTNFATMGVISSLKRLGIVAPDDISLIGFDDYTWMQVATPSITAVAQPIDRIAAAAWSQLHARIDGDDHTATRLRLGCRLEIRQSTRAVGPPLAALGRSSRGPRARTPVREPSEE